MNAITFSNFTDMTFEEYKQYEVEAKDAINEIVEKYGWYVVLIEGTDYSPSFAYTGGTLENL